MIRTTIAAAALMTLALSAQAAPASPLYAGAALGQADYRLGCEGLADCDDRAGAGKVYMGIHLNEAAEGAIQGSIEATYFRARPAVAHEDGFNVSARTHGLAVAYKASYRTGALDLSARLGGAYSRSRVVVPGIVTDHTSHFGATYGIGASLKLSDAWALTLDADRVPAKYGDEKQGANLYTAGLRYAF